MDYLRGKDLVRVEQTGVTITSEGRKFIKQLPLRLKRLEPTELTMNNMGAAVQVKKYANKVSMGIEQRDSAIRAGAQGAITIVVQEGRLLVPPDFVLDENHPRITKRLREGFDLSEGDVIIVGTAPNYVKAENGALAAAFDIL